MSIEQMRKALMLKYGKVIKGRSVDSMCDYQVLAIYTKLLDRERSKANG